MLERYPSAINDEGWPAVVRMLCERNRFSVSEIDLFIFTQVRKRTIEKVMNELGAPMDKAHTIMEKWGYTGSACIPMALDDAIQQGRARPGDTIVLVGSGVGHNQAGIALRVTEAMALPGSRA